ncbi:MAG: hypothetical protein WBV22_11445 [Anaerolineaceae bacterium]
MKVPASVTRSTRYILSISSINLFSALYFWTFFTISKVPPFVNDNPFANDPYDAIGSFAFQISVISGILSLARAVDVHLHAERDWKEKYILHGCWVSQGAIAVTVLVDILAWVLNPVWKSSISGIQLLVGLVSLAMLTIIMTITLLLMQSSRNYKGMQVVVEPADRPAELADALWDVYNLFLFPILRLAIRSPAFGRLITYLGKFPRKLLDSLEKYAGCANPRFHPWRFSALIGILSGIGLVLFGLIAEGVPPSLNIFVLLVFIFVGGETTAILLVMLFLGRYLHLRPPIKK